MPFVPTPAPWQLWFEHVRYTIEDVDALSKLCRQSGLKLFNMEVLVGHKQGNTTGERGGKSHENGWVRWSEVDVKWLKHPLSDEIVPTCGPAYGRGGGQLFLAWAQAQARSDMPFKSAEMLVKLFFRKMHKGKPVENIFGWTVVPKPTDAEQCWPHVVVSSTAPSANPAACALTCVSQSRDPIPLTVILCLLLW